MTGIQMRHLHKEAYCLMTYQSESGETKRIWNSRDGVTPFGIQLNGQEMRHVDWHDDQYLPLYVPLVGSLIFVDLTLAKAIAYRTAHVEEWWDHPQMPMSQHDYLGPLGKAGAITLLAQADIDQAPEDDPPPDLVRVTPEIHAVFNRRFQELKGSWPYVYRRLIGRQTK